MNFSKCLANICPAVGAAFTPKCCHINRRIWSDAPDCPLHCKFDFLITKGRLEKAELSNEIVISIPLLYLWNTTLPVYLGSSNNS